MELFKSASDDFLGEKRIRIGVFSVLAGMGLAGLLAGGQALGGFSFCVAVGIIVDTCSSIVIASPSSVFWLDWVDSRRRSVVVLASAASTGAQMTAAAAACGSLRPVEYTARGQARLVLGGGKDSDTCLNRHS
jgi:hypothetical protein